MHRETDRWIAGGCNPRWLGGRGRCDEDDEVRYNDRRELWQHRGGPKRSKPEWTAVMNADSQRLLAFLPCSQRDQFPHSLP
jgi:hypothetical protein